MIFFFVVVVLKTLSLVCCRRIKSWMEMGDGNNKMKLNIFKFEVFVLLSCHSRKFNLDMMLIQTKKNGN